MKHTFPRVIVLAGLMGSGKSTLVAMLAKKLGYAQADGGTIRRAMASELGMSIEDFSEYTKNRLKYDRETDRRLITLAKKGNIVMQSRVLPYLKEAQQLPSVCMVYLLCNKRERARRIAQREGISVAQALRNIAIRDRNDHIRFKKFYGIDISSRNVYDVVVNNSRLSPQETLKVAFDKLKNW